MNLRHVRTSLARFNVASREADRAFQELIGALRAAMVVAQEDEPKQPRATRVRSDSRDLSTRRLPEVTRRPYTH